jgi:uncharacterized protein YkwD
MALYRILPIVLVACQAPTTFPAPVAQAPAPLPATRAVTLGAADHVLMRVDPGRGLRLVEDARDVPSRWQGAVVVDFKDAPRSMRGYYVAPLFDAEPGQTHTARLMSRRGFNRLTEDLLSAAELAEQAEFQAAAQALELAQRQRAQADSAPARRKRARGAASTGAPAAGLIIESVGGRVEPVGFDGVVPSGASLARAPAGVAKRPSGHGAMVAGVVDATNRARGQTQDCGLHGKMPPVGPLSRNSKLDDAAQSYAELMASRGHFGHTGPDGSTPSTRAKAAGYKVGAGENLAVGQRTPEVAVEGWIESDGHCQNLMLGRYKAIGVGVADGPDGRRYWVQMFGELP